jgi:hypothetical protein
MRLLTIPCHLATLRIDSNLLAKYVLVVAGHCSSNHGPFHTVGKRCKNTRLGFNHVNALNITLTCVGQLKTHGLLGRLLHHQVYPLSIPPISLEQLLMSVPFQQAASFLKFTSKYSNPKSCMYTAKSPIVLHVRDERLSCLGLNVSLPGSVDGVSNPPKKFIRAISVNKSRLEVNICVTIDSDIIDSNMKTYSDNDAQHCYLPHDQP